MKNVDLLAMKIGQVFKSLKHTLKWGPKRSRPEN